MLTINIKLKDGREIKDCSVFSPNTQLGEDSINDKNILEHVLYGGYNVIVQNLEGFNKSVNTNEINSYEIIEEN